MKYLLASILLVCNLAVSAQLAKKTELSPDLQIIELAPNIYQHISVDTIGSYGRVSSNGLIFVDGKKAFLFDTPYSEEKTIALVKWMQNDKKLKIEGFVPNHWHNDCTGGMGYLIESGIKTYGNILTTKILRDLNEPAPQISFTDSISLKLNDKVIECWFPGAAHSLDNIVVWIPSQKVLFAGCMIKEFSATTLGNVADGDLKAYPATIRRLIDRYPDVAIVVPGHGKAGGKELLEHTHRMALRAQK